jgi:hypothetical protein
MGQSNGAIALYSLFQGVAKMETERCPSQLFLLGIELREDFFGGVKSGVGCGQAAVDRRLQQDFLDFIAGDAEPQSRF